MQGEQCEPNADLRLAVDDLMLNAATGEVWRGGEPLPLSAGERALLAALLQHRDTTVSKKALTRAVWGMETPSSNAYLALYVRYLQQKLEVDPAHPRYLRVEGNGYRFVVGAAPSQVARQRAVSAIQPA